jgi:hypothetical protein
MTQNDLSAWVPVAAAAVGATPGLLIAAWVLRDSRRTRRDDLVRVAVRNLLAEAMGAPYLLGVLGSPAVRKAARWRLGFVLDQLGEMDARLSRLMMAKAEFDLLVDSQELHDAADRLLDAVSSRIDMSMVTPTPTQTDLDRSQESLKQARLNLIHRVRKVMPGIVTERRTWSLFRRGEAPACQGELRPKVHSKSVHAGRDSD